MVHATTASWVPECAEDELLVALVAVRRAMQASMAGADPGTFPVLHHLAATGPTRQGHLAEALGLDASTVSRHVRALVEDGLVQAERDPSDGRATVLSVAPAGERALVERLHRHREVLAVATSGFTAEERAELVRLLGKFADTLSQQRGTS